MLAHELTGFKVLPSLADLRVEFINELPVIFPSQHWGQTTTVAVFCHLGLNPRRPTNPTAAMASPLPDLLSWSRLELSSFTSTEGTVCHGSGPQSPGTSQPLLEVQLLSANIKTKKCFFFFKSQ